MKIVAFKKIQSGKASSNIFLLPKDLITLCFMKTEW